MLRVCLRPIVCALALTAWATAQELRADEKSAADLLPGSAVFYAELSQPRELLGTVLDHPLRAHVLQHPLYRQATSTPQFAKFQAALTLVEGQLGVDWRAGLEKLTAGGVHVAIDLPTQGVALLVRSGDAALLEKARDVFLQIAAGESARRGQPNPVKTAQYKSITTYQLGDARLAIAGPWLVATNKDGLGRMILDNYLGADRHTLSEDNEFQAARASVVGKPTAWAFGRIGLLRNFGVGANLYNARSDNPAAELLFGGILSTLAKTPYATASLYAEKEGLRLALAVPHDPSWTNAPRQFYFGPEGRGRAPAPLLPKEMLLSITTYRDLSGLWTSANELFVDQVSAQFDQAESGLNQFFAGRDFGTDVLGAVRPELQFVARRQQFDSGSPRQPAVKLPAFGLVMRLKESDKFASQMRVSFQSLIGFINIVGAQQGQPPFELDDDKQGSTRILSASYVLDEQSAKNKGLINYNFSPALAMAGDRMMLCSTKQLAAELAALAVADKGAPQADGAVNSLVTLDASVLHDVLRDNQAHLVAQNVLQKGHDQQKAQQEIDALVGLLQYLRGATLRLENDGKWLRLEAGVALAAPK